MPIVFTSTSDVYGNAETPFREDGEIVLGPPTSRRWSYAASKYFDEHLALRMHEERGLKVSILRLFNAYGARNHPSWWGGPLAVFLEDLLDGKEMEIHGDGQQVRSFTYVSDTVDGFVRALGHPGGDRRGHQHRQRGAGRRSSTSRRRSRPRWASTARCGPRSSPTSRWAATTRTSRSASPRPRRPQRILGFKAQVKLEARPREDHRLAPRAARGARSRRDRSPPAQEAPAARSTAGKRDAALLSIGTVASGVLAYAFNVLAARALGPEAFAAVGALWAGMFLIAVLLFRPLEQTVSRTVADHVARGADARARGAHARPGSAAASPSPPAWPASPPGARSPTACSAGARS